MKLLIACMRRPIPFLIASVLAAAANHVAAQGRLPPCSPSVQISSWSNCVGEVTARDGAMYAGEYKDGEYHGQGTYTFPSGAKYVGAYRDGKRNGQGAYAFSDGAKYVGEHKDGMFHGKGVFSFPDGRKYVGGYKDGKYNGQGSEYRPDGSILRSGIWDNGTFRGK